MTVQLFDPAQLVKSGFMSGRGDASRSVWLARADLEHLFHQLLGVVAVDISHVIYPCLLTRILFVEDCVASAALLTFAGRRSRLCSPRLFPVLLTGAVSGQTLRATSTLPRLRVDDRGTW